MENRQFLFIIVYGCYNASDRIGLWYELGNLSQSINESWIVSCEFNAVMSNGDSRW